MITITLKHPIKIDGREAAQLTLRRPKVRDLERMDKVSGEMAKTVALVADLAEITPDQVRELDAGDFNVVAEALAGFLEGFRPTSGKSSPTLQ